ncbi:MAG TPA: alkaline phosphatase family protein [Thermoanaerobaculia bacterium]|nr:alkaline phosphatase family protein [Thermoanaerobaculia bacterium]
MKRALLLACLVLGCQSAPPPPPEPASPPPAGPSRVVLLSLDGAGADELHRLYNEGLLQPGGFAAFFEQGQVAERLIPVNPTLTAVNHISLATGYTASETGIVSNTFHPAGEAPLKTASGFAAPIGTETLWEAARRQGKRVGVTTWPGADDTGPRRRADWGMIYVNDADRPARLLEVARQDWEPWRGENRVESRSPVLATGVQIGEAHGPGQNFELLAVDRKANVPGYDGVVVLPRPEEDSGRLPVVLDPGEWGTVRCSWIGLESEPRQDRCRVKVLSLAPDLSSARVYFGALYPLQAYPEDFAASLEAQGLSWPGPPDDRRLADTWSGKPGLDLDTWTEQGVRFAVFFGESLRIAAERSDWDLIMGYVPVIDEAGHQLLLADPRQPGYTPERVEQFAHARLRVWQAVDRQLARLLDILDLRNTTLIVVSDHGMEPVHTSVNPNVLLRERGLLAMDAEGKIVPEGTAVYAVSSGEVSHIYAMPGREAALSELRKLFQDWTLSGDKPVERVFTRKEAAEIGLEHPNTGDLVLFAAPGYTFGGGGLKEGKAALPTPALGMHGGLNTHPSLHGIYMAIGAGIEPGDAGTVRTIDVAGRVAERMGIEKPRPRPVSP